MTKEAVKKKLAECKTVLEKYRGYGQAAEGGLKELDRVGALVDEGKNAEAYAKVEGLCGMIAPYRSYVPDVALLADELRDEVKKLV